MDDDEVCSLVEQVHQVSQLEDELQRLRAYTSRIETGMLRLAERLIHQTAHSIAFGAVLDAFMAAHPDSPVMAPTGAVVEAEGQRRARLRCNDIYDRAFNLAAAGEEILRSQS